MGENTRIEWAHHTFNPWIGCQKVGPGCDHCYAEKERAVSSLGVKWGAHEQRHRTSAATWKNPLKWNREAEHLGIRYRVFCASLADVFDNAVTPDWRLELFELIRATPHLDWLLLTKRIGNAQSMIEQVVGNMDIGYVPAFAAWPWPNVWLGVTICNQEEANRDIPKLLAVPAAIRFLSMEPLLGPVDLTPAFLPCPNAADGISMDPETGAYECCHQCDYTGIGNEIGVDWVIVGGESGPKARPMHPKWARSLRDQCADMRVPFLFKQWGEWYPGEDDKGFIWIPEKKMIDTYIQDARMYRAGKIESGRLLDRELHDGYPEVQP